MHRGWGQYGSHALDMVWVLAYRIEDGRIREARNIAQDQAAAADFFWKVWGERLSPLPGRITAAPDPIAG